MAKETEKVEKVEKTKSEREARWEIFLAKYEKQNPTKYASRKENGEFDKIPDSFV